MYTGEYQMGPSKLMKVITKLLWGKALMIIIFEIASNLAAKLASQPICEDSLSDHLC